MRCRSKRGSFIASLAEIAGFCAASRKRDAYSSGMAGTLPRPVMYPISPMVDGLLSRGTNRDPAEPKRDLDQSPEAKARSGNVR